MNCCTQCGHVHQSTRSCENSSGPVSRFIGFIVKAAIVYVVLVFGSGTLINTGKPVAVEAGRLIQTITFVEPAIRWTDREGWDGVSNGLQILANGAAHLRRVALWRRVSHRSPTLT